MPLLHTRTKSQLTPIRSDRMSLTIKFRQIPPGVRPPMCEVDVPFREKLTVNYCYHNLTNLLLLQLTHGRTDAASSAVYRWRPAGL
jgi:hypothetical protein